MMKKALCTLMLLVCLLCNGCKFLESFVSDVDGWNLSACVDGFGTCFELWRDNADKFGGGFVEAMNNLP